MLPVGMTVRDFVEKARDIYLSENSACQWEDIMKRVIKGNTARGLPQGTLQKLREHFTLHQKRIIKALIRTESRDQLNTLENRLCSEVRRQLRKAASNAIDKKTHYNKLRKPVDLCLSALVSMAAELRQPSRHREDLVSWLFLPLDSQMLANPAVFTAQELREYNLGRRSTYGDIKDETTYKGLQSIARKRARRISKLHRAPFCPVFFDMFWNDNYRNNGHTWFAVRQTHLNVTQLIRDAAANGTKEKSFKAKLTEHYKAKCWDANRIRRRLDSCWGKVLRLRRQS